MLKTLKQIVTFGTVGFEIHRNNHMLRKRPLFLTSMILFNIYLIYAIFINLIKFLIK